MKKTGIFLLIAGVGLASPGYAVNGVAVEGGRGDSTDVAQISLVRQWDRQWFTAGHWFATGYWSASVGHWHASSAGGQDILDVALTPVFRLQRKPGSGLQPYLEAAVGLHLISHTHVDAERDMGSAFQFGDHVGAGLIFGHKGEFELGYRFQHLSNADLKRPNDGINFQQLRFAYLF